MDTSVEGLIKEVELTVYKINKYCDLLILGNTQYADRYILVLSDAFTTVMPKIMNAYNEVDSLKNEDSSVWGFILKRIFEVLKGDDDMMKIDVLKLETVENLMILLKELRRCDEQ